MHYNKTIIYSNLNYIIIINNILDNLFYKEKLGIGNKTTFIKKVRETRPGRDTLLEIKVKDIQKIFQPT